MKDQILKLQFLFFLSFGLFFVACDKDEALSSDEIQNFTDESIFKLQEEANCGRHGCYELVFPIAVTLGDAEITINSYLELKEAIIAWKQSDPSTTDRPQFVYPIDLMDGEGNIYTAEGPADLREYKKLCLRYYFQNHGWGGHSNGPMSCFRLVYPVTLELPSGITVTVLDAQQLKNVLREWKENHEGPIDQRPVLVFPLTVEMEDGTLVEIEDREALKNLKDECVD